jgi:hypothetical protein
VFLRCGLPAPARFKSCVANAGRSVTYTNVVRAINKLGDWIGQTGTFDLPGTAGGDEDFIVLVQKGTPERPGVILAAAKTEGL